MKKIILLLLLIILFQSSRAQTVKGTILDYADHSVIGYASIYINGTYVGTNSDQNGHFELDLSNHNSLPLTISALGYYSVTLTDFSTEKALNIYLKQKTFELNEIKISARTQTKEKKANLKLFRTEFLGITENARNCDILNENDLLFTNSPNDDTLKVYASKPIIITNNGLGYRLTYYLDKFEYFRKSKSFLYMGNGIFNEDMNEKLIRKGYFDKKRKNAYLGSRSHFFSSLWANALKSNGFIIKNSDNKILNYEDIVIERAGYKKYISYKGILNICYFSETPNSYIELLKDPVFFDRSGYFDGSGVRIVGMMAKQRVGDLLPYDYKLK